MNARTEDDETALTFAALNRHVEIVQQLLKAKAEVNPEGKLTPLLSAAMGGDLRVVETLLVKGAAMNGETSLGGTALMGAAASGYPDVVRLLLSKGRT